MSGRLRVALADDHAVVRAGYRRLLELEPELAVVAEFADSEVTYQWFAERAAADGGAEVLVLDLSMPGRGGMETLRRLKARQPQLRVLIFSMYDNPAVVSQALRAGADGYVTKSSPPETLVAAVHRTARGELALSADVADALDDLANRPRALHLELSPREFDIFRLLASGASVDEIAAKLFLSIKTVANYQTAIRQKTGLNSALEMFRYVGEHGLLLN